MTSIKGHYIIILQKFTCNNPNLDLAKINANTKFGQIHQFVLKILSGNKILTSIITIKGHNSVINLRKFMSNNPNLELASIDANTKFGQKPSICSPDIERK